jgi:hypothetical protein
MPVKLNSSGGGSVTLTTPSTASDFTATFPANTGNVVTDSATQTLTNKTLNGAVMTAMASSVLTPGTAQASTSGTSIDFTGVPSWVKRITVMLNGVSTNGTSILMVQLGSGSFVTTGYLAAGSGVATTVNTATSTAGFIFGNTNRAVDTSNGALVLTNISGNTWVGIGSVYLATSTPQTNFAAGVSPALSGALDRVRITTVGGTDTFDAGSINIIYE